MNSERMELSKKRKNEILRDYYNPLSESDPDFTDIYNGFVFGEVFALGNLSDKEKSLITLVVLTAVQTPKEIGPQTEGALNVGASPVEIKEALYQCIPYVGFSKTAEALKRVNKVFKNRNISLPVESQSRVTEADRFEKGLEVQKSIFGNVIDIMHQNAPENQKHIFKDYLSAFCFGDIYTRGTLDVKFRELLTLSILVSLGGCESQVKSHIQGNLAVGNTKEMMIGAITQALPFIGFPRTLNALTCLNEIIPEK